MSQRSGNYSFLHELAVEVRKQLPTPVSAPTGIQDPWFVKLETPELKRQLNYYKRLSKNPHCSAYYRENTLELIPKMEAELAMRTTRKETS